MPNKKRGDELDAIILDLNKMWNEVNEKIEILKRIYSESDMYIGLGNTRLSEFEEVLAFRDAKKETWYQLATEGNIKNHVFGTLSRKEKKIRVTISMIGKSISLLEKYIDKVAGLKHESSSL